jgi:hypothetical protein
MAASEQLAMLLATLVDAAGKKRFIELGGCIHLHISAVELADKSKNEDLLIVL